MDEKLFTKDSTILPERQNVVMVEASWRNDRTIVDEVERLRDRFLGSDVCVAEALCDSHPVDATAFFCVDEHLNVVELSFGELADESKRLASALRAQGIGQGSRVGVLMGKSRQLPIVLLALWRLGAVQVPLFTAFAGPAIAQRVTAAGAELIIADKNQVPKLDGIDIAVLESGERITELVLGADPISESAVIGGDGLFIQLYTSGTTGTPKAVGVPAFALAGFLSYMKYGLDLQKTDVFWNAADPGWAYGLYYAIVGPLALGVPNILLSAGFSAELTGKLMKQLGVTNLAASPTVFRALKTAGLELSQPLRVVSSAGEPLTPDVIEWAPLALGTEVRDHWGQTEQGMAIVNAWDERLKQPAVAGSMGQAMPGFVGGLVGSSIALSVKHSLLMWFRGYVDAPEQTRERYTSDGEWYLSGDVGRCDGENFFFASRDDDVILAAGYRIAPFDIESILTSVPGVRESAVVGRSDDVRGEVVEAFVVISPDLDVDGLDERLQQTVRAQYGAHAYPRRIHIVKSLPKTPSGKVQRFVLRNVSDEEIARL